MKLKDVGIFGVFILVGWLLMKFVIIDMEDISVIIYFILLPGLIFIFNFLMRKNVGFQPYFTSKYNFLTSKYEATVSSDLTKELMFKKMLEVIENSNLALVYADEKSSKIIATKGLTWQSWGENIYIDFEEKGNSTRMNFVSTTVIGIVSWGKNEQNYNRLLSTYEESLTI